MSFLRAGRTGVRFLHNLPSSRVGSGSNSLKRLERASPLTPSSSSVTAPTTGRLPASTILSIIRSFADRPAGRPKQHTGKAPARKTGVTGTRATKKTTTAGTKAKKTTAPKKPSQTALKAKQAAARRKTRDQAKVKAARQKEIKTKQAQRERERTRVAKAKESLAALKEASLVSSEPRSQHMSSYIAFFKSAHPRHKAALPPGAFAKFETSAKVTQAIAEEFRNLSPEDREAWNHRANAETEAIYEAYTKWLHQHTPEQILKANRARDTLRARGVQGYKKVHHIKDPRYKRPLTSYMLFVKERFASGDMKSIKAAEALKLVAREWQELPQSEKERFKARAAAANTQ